MSRKAEKYMYNLILIAVLDCTNGACNTRKSDFWMSNPKFKTLVLELYTTDNYISGLLIHRTLNLPFFILNICWILGLCWPAYWPSAISMKKSGIPSSSKLKVDSVTLATPYHRVKIFYRVKSRYFFMNPAQVPIRKVLIRQVPIRKVLIRKVPAILSPSNAQDY